jgi:D-alanyl-D-alanine carboxypeptidase/D-alanyl-D-alanine-endopeptidase (penicillin-binding protein 4)
VLGDLFLQGGGDPELDTDALPPLVAALRSAGVTGVDGALVADGTALPQVSEITTAQEVEAAYNPSISGLNLNFNRVHVKWDARKGNGRLSVEAAAGRLSPQVEIVRVALASAPGAPLFASHEEGGSEHWQMAREAYRGRAARWLPVKRPELYAGEVFRKLAAEAGIALEPARAGRAPAGAEVLAVHQSRPLADILREMLLHSTNLTAEVTGAAAARAIGAEAGSLAQSAAVMNAWAASVAGFPLGDPEFRLVNHSGLTLESRVSPRRMVALLASLGRRGPGPSAGPSAGLSAGHAGLPGGIARYLRPLDVAADGVPIDFRRLEVVAKTGTMSYVRGLAGYVATPGGHRLAFAIFSNDLDRRGDGPERVDKAWMGRAKGFERALIRSWVVRADWTA